LDIKGRYFTQCREFCKDFDGLIVFYRNAVADNPNSERIEHKALFSDGKMIKLNGKML